MKNTGKIFCLVAAMLLLNGCTTLTLYKIATGNQERLSRVSLGMTREKVSSIMGTQTMRCSGVDFFMAVKNPYRAEFLKDNKGREFEVLYYFIEIGRNTRWEKRSIADRNLIPLVFRHNRLVGIGWDFFNKRFFKNN